MKTEYKTHQVIMLPTNKSKLALFEDNKLSWTPERNHYYETGGYNIKAQHLYILSDEKIKEGDWYILLNGGKHLNKICRFKNQPIEVELLKQYNCKKIIATTDTSLKLREYTEEEKDKAHNNKLPNIWLYKIPQHFIEHYIKEYNKGNIITKANVEYYKTIVDKNTDSEIHHFGFEFDDAVDSGHIIPTEKYQLKTTVDNTISILPAKTSWSREEVESILFDYAEQEHAWFSTKSETDSFNKWIKENL